MGVKGLWQILNSTGKPITLESLENQILAVDVSIWMNQALRGVRDRRGIVITDAHLLFLFQRICKLLHYRIKPVFVFDGPPPILKQRLLDRRRNRRNVAESRAQKLTKQLLENLVQQEAVAVVSEKNAKLKSTGARALRVNSSGADDMFVLPNSFTDADGNTRSNSSGSETSSESEDELSLSVANGIDLDKLDIKSADFLSLPPHIRHDILVEMQAARRQPSWESVRKLPEESEKFSRFQLKRLLTKSTVRQSLDATVREINSRKTSSISQKLRDNLDGTLHNLDAQRIASEDAHYVLAKRQKVDIDIDVGGHIALKDGSVLKNPPLIDLENVSSEEFVPNPDALPAGKLVLKAKANSQSKPDLEICESSLIPQPKKLSFVELKRPEELTSKHILCMDKDVRISTLNSDSFIVLPTPLGEDNDLLPMSSEISDPSRRRTSCALFFDEVASHAPQVDMKIQGLLDSVPKELSSTAFVNKSGVEMISPTTSPIFSQLPSSQNSLSSIFNKLDTNPVLPKNNIPATTINISDSDTESDDDFIEVPAEPPLNIGVKDSINEDVIDLCSESRESSPSELETDLLIPGNLDQEELDEGTAEVSVEDLDILTAHLNNIGGQLRTEKEREERVAASISDQMRNDFQELLQLFGIPFINSPGEAEAQCAFLDFTKQTHGTITDDSDIWLFGGQKVYRHFFNQKRHVERFAAEDIERQLGLTRDKLIALSLLTGSDYTEGLESVGGVRALEIMAEFGGEGVKSLKDFKSWWNEAAERRENGDFRPESKLRAVLMDLKLPDNFPEALVVNGYENPEVDNSTEKFTWEIPALDLLRTYTKKKFGWSQQKTDELLLPLVKRITNRESQTHLDSFFSYHLKPKETIRSRRIEAALQKIKQGDTSLSKTKTGVNKKISRRRAKNIRKDKDKDAVGRQASKSGSGTSSSAHLKIN